MKRLLFCVVAFFLLSQSFSSATITHESTAKDDPNFTIDNTDPSISYFGEWLVDNGDYLNGSSTFSKNGAFSFAFNGTGFQYIGTTMNANRSIYIYIDGQLEDTASLKANSIMNKQILYEHADLNDDHHIVVISSFPLDPHNYAPANNDDPANQNFTDQFDTLEDDFVLFTEQIFIFRDQFSRILEDGIHNPNDIRNKLDELKGQLDQLKGKLDALKTQVDRFKSRVDEVKALSTNEFRWKYDDLKGKLDDLKGLMDQFKGRMDDLKGGIDGLKGNSYEINSRFQTLLDSFDIKLLEVKESIQRDFNQKIFVLQQYIEEINQSITNSMHQISGSINAYSINVDEIRIFHPIPVKVPFDSGILDNGDFELHNAEANIADKWYSIHSAGVSADYLLVKLPQMPGETVQQLTIDHLLENQIGGMYQPFTAEAGRTFTLSGQVYVEQLSGAKAQLYLDFYNSSGVTVGTSIAEQDVATEGFITLSRSGIVPSTATQGRLYVIVRGTEAGGSAVVYADQLSLELGELVDFPVEPEPPIPAPASGIIRNGGFEQYNAQSDVADNWSKVIPAGVSAQYSVTHDPIVSGERAQKLSISNLAPGQLGGLYQLLAVESGKTYELEGKVYVEQLDGAKVQLYLDFYNASGVTVGANIVEQTTTTAGYVSLSGNGTIPSTATQGRLYVIARGTETGGSAVVYVDQLSLELEPDSPVEPEPPIPAPASGIIRNGGFEQYNAQSDVADNWSKVIPAGAAAQYSVIHDPVVSGERAQKLSVSNLAPGQLGGLYQSLAIESGKTYELEGKVYVEQLDGAKVQLYLDFYNASGVTVGTSIAEQAMATEGYITLGGSGIVPSTATQGRLYVIARGTEAGGSAVVYVDQLSLELGESTIPLLEPEPPIPAPASGIIRNGGFEQYNAQSDVAGNWSKVIPAGVSAQYLVTHDPVASGERAQKLSISNLAPGQLGGLYQSLAVESGKTYELEGKIYVEQLDGAKVQLYLDFYNASGVTVGATIVELTTTTAGYVTLSGNGTIPGTATQGRLHVIARGTEAGGSAVVYADELSILVMDS